MLKPLYHDGLSKQRIMTQHSVSGKSQTSNPSIPRSDSICHFYRRIWESLSIQKWPLFSQFHIFLSPRFYLKSEGDIVIASVRPLCYLLLNHWTKFNQIWCVSYSHEWGAQCKFFLAPPPGALGRGQKVKYYLISITKSISKIFVPNFVCVPTNENPNLVEFRPMV